MSLDATRAVIIEFHVIGNVVKVTAFDEESLTEVVIQGARGTAEEILKKIALQKLEYMLRKKKVIA